MLFRIIILVIVVGLGYYIFKMASGNSEYKRCEKCDGQGYWRATRGEKDKCDVCKGSGKVLRRP